MAQLSGFPWEAAIQAGISLGAQQAQRSQQGGTSEKDIGRAFDDLDRQIAAYLTPLLAAPTITPGQLNQVAEAVGKLQGFAQQYANIAYVARRWSEAQGQYTQVVNALVAKLPPANTATVTDAAGNPVGIIQQGSLIAGIDNTALLLFGGVLILVLILKR